MGVTLKIEALVFNLCQKLVKENFIECDYQNRIVKIEVNVQFNVLNKEFCSRLDRILLAFMLQLVESKICDSEAEPPLREQIICICADICTFPDLHYRHEQTSAPFDKVSI